MKKKKTMKWVSGLAAACLVAAFAVLAAPLFRRETAPTQTTVPGKDEAGGLNGKINITAERVLTGTEYAITDEEGYAFLESRKTGIENELKAFGVDTEGFRISEKGFAHMRTGNDGNSMAVDWRDFLAYCGDEITAILTVHKDGTGMYRYTAWGSPSFPDYTRFLKEHKGEELVYIWIGDVDAILTPEGGLYSFGNDLSVAVNADEQARYYEFFKLEQNTYIPN